ncbi:unnamed protein product [Rotaria sp. Silwood2]|nr:unnamed protein product [Rotaria sp. Silwood2]CAF3936612.1 unnamed protein product [Rotaria sp. Silwood2]
MTWDTPIVTWSYPLFSQFTRPCIAMPKTKCSSLWQSLLNIVNFRHTNDDDAEDNVNLRQTFMDPDGKIFNLFYSKYNLYLQNRMLLYIMNYIKAYSNFIDLKINVRLLIFSKLFDNPCLMPIFKQIKILKLITEQMYLPSNSALKFVQRFSSLTRIELKVFSFDNCISIIDIFLSHLQHLSYAKINYDQVTLLDDPFSRDYIIEKRHQQFPDTFFDETMVNVKYNGESFRICLS